MTLNLKGLTDEWFLQRFSIIAHELKLLNPDLVALQESVIRYDPKPIYHQARQLGNAIKLPICAFSPYGNPHEPTAQDQGGIALLSKWPICKVQNLRLPSSDLWDSRVALLAEFQTDFGLLNVINTHLSWRPNEGQIRTEQINLLLRELLDESDARRLYILLGDLNAHEHEPSLGKLTKHLNDTYRIKNPDQKGYTWDNSNPLSREYGAENRRLDYIFCSKKFKILESKLTLNEAKPTFASDHFGVYSELEAADD
jgi:endonuclease/exonuclease/phosphatase family metal-dependent hydrolase